MDHWGKSRWSVSGARRTEPTTCEPQLNTLTTTPPSPPPPNERRCRDTAIGLINCRDIGPVAQPWRRLSRPKSRSRRSRNGDRWAAIACIAQLGSATAVAGRRQLSRHGDSRRGTATAVTERRQPSPRRQPSRKGYEDHQSATAYSITIGLSRRLALATPVAKWRWVSPYGDGCRHGDGCRQMAMGVAKWR